MSEPSLVGPLGTSLKALGLFPAVVGHDLVPVVTGASPSDSEEEAGGTSLALLVFLLPLADSFFGLGLCLVAVDGSGEASYLIFRPRPDSIFFLDT